MCFYYLSGWGGVGGWGAAAAALAPKAPAGIEKLILRVSVAYFEGTLIIIEPGQEINDSVRLLGPHTGNLMNIKRLFLFYFLVLNFPF